MPDSILERTGVSVVRYAQVWEDADVLLAGLDVRPGDACVSIASAGDNTLALLTASSGDKAVCLRWNVSSLPCFTVWKNSLPLEEGYVTGLEPATGYPNFKAFERERGREELRGTFSRVLSEAARAGVGPEEIQNLISNLRIRPVLTAHPTESKRVTVLEKYRKTYLLLRELENPRWTERERAQLVDELAVRDRIDLAHARPGALLDVEQQARPAEPVVLVELGRAARTDREAS